ncbi:hypothetical protein LY78DRAFT_316258 [Colletotrichum sublineola]|nr:hypothetical protein LY78DRAFT_316258 [Colletotrichum sublineola]
MAAGLSPQRRPWPSWLNGSRRQSGPGAPLGQASQRCRGLNVSIGTWHGRHDSGNEVQIEKVAISSLARTSSKQERKKAREDAGSTGSPAYEASSSSACWSMTAGMVLRQAPLKGGQGIHSGGVGASWRERAGAGHDSRSQPKGSVGRGAGIGPRIDLDPK